MDYDDSKKPKKGRRTVCIATWDSKAFLLCFDWADCLIRRLQDDIRFRYDSIPAEQKYNRKTPVITGDHCLNTHRILLYLFSLENSFLLQNAVSKRKGLLPKSQLLKTSLAMFSTVVKTCETSAQLSNLAFILSWLVRIRGFVRFLFPCVSLLLSLLCR